MSAGLPLVVTRADPGGAATAGRARALGIDARPMPLFAVRPLAWTAPDPSGFDALLLTSAQAARLGGGQLAHLAALPVFAVGAATAVAAEDAGLRVATQGEGDVQRLLDSMASRPMGRILWLCGRDRTEFDARGAELVSLPVYAVDAVEPPDGWAGVIAEPAVLMAHSARGAARIAELVGAARKHLTLLAISGAAARAGGEGWGKIAISSRADDAAMLAEAHALCHKGQ